MRSCAPVRRWPLAAVAVMALVGTTVAIPATSAVAASPTLPTSLMTPTLIKEIQNRVDNYLTANKLTGLSVAVVTPGQSSPQHDTRFFYSGVPTVGSSTPVSGTTQFELGSETKAFTADLLAYLVSSNKVSLDDPVQKYAPAGVTVPVWTDPTTGATTPITLRDLATHQAGLLDDPPNLSAGCTTPNCQNPRPGYTQTLLWQAFTNYTLPWKPGTNWSYSDWGFGLLGTILSNVVNPVPETEAPAFGAALNSTFLTPLGLSSTLVEPYPTPATSAPNLATPYNNDNTIAFYWENVNAVSGGGALISDAQNMGEWAAANLGYVGADAAPGVLTMPDTLRPVSTITTQCTNLQQCKPSDGLQMGLAWQLYPAGSQNVGAPWAGKDGGTAGFTSYTALAPSLGLGVTLMFNQGNLTGTHGPDDLAVPLLALLVAARNAVPTTTPISSGTAAVTPLAATGPSYTWQLLTIAGALLVLGLAMQRAGRTARRPATRKH